MMIRRIPINLLQQWLYTILSTKQDTPVYDSIPEFRIDENGDILLDDVGNPIPAAKPYILLSDYEYEMNGAKNVDITEITFELEIWTDYEGKAEINRIAEEITTVLTAWPLDLSEHGFNAMGQDIRGGKGTREGDLFCGVVYFVAKIQNVGA